MPSNNKLNSPEVKQKLKESFAALNEEKDKKRAVIRELFAGDPKMIEGKEIGMRKTMNEERVKEHEKEIEKIYGEDFFIKRIEKNPNIIRNLKNPSEKVQLVAVQQDWRAIEYIENPSEKVQLVAVQQDWRAIEYIENPSEEVQLVAVQQDWSAIEYIENPSEKVQLVAVQQDWSAIEDIKNPAVKVLELALEKKKREWGKKREIEERKEKKKRKISGKLSKWLGF